MQVELDTAGGSNYADMGTQQMFSVPYALYAANGNWSRQGNAIYNSNTGNVSVGTSTPASSAKFEINSTTKGFLPPHDGNAAQCQSKSCCRVSNILLKLLYYR